MKPPFTSSQEMYNYAANQLMNQGLSQEAVKNNLMARGVTDADAEICIQNMLVAIEKRRNADANQTQTGADIAHSFASTPQPSAQTNQYGSFNNIQEMYNYAADQMIVKKLPQQTVSRNLMNLGVSPAQADEVIKNMLVEMNKNKPTQVNTKRAEGRRMLLVGLIIGGVGGLLYGTPFTIAGESYQISHGILVIGALIFFRGLFKMF